MDLIMSARLRSWGIGLLIVMNAVMIVLFWMQWQREPAVRTMARGGDDRAQAVLPEIAGFTDEQASRYQILWEQYRNGSRAVNDRISANKRALAAALFRPAGTASKADSISRLIGADQAELEQTRFRHFAEVLSLCTPEQREALRPSIEAVFSRKPPKDDGVRKEKEPVRNDPRPALSDKKNGGRRGENILPAERQAPPAMDEKVERYARRLHLSDEQQRKLQRVLQEVQNEKGKGLSREERRMNEEKKVMELLTPEQRTIFKEMQERRRQE